MATTSIDVSFRRIGDSQFIVRRGVYSYGSLSANLAAARVLNLAADQLEGHRDTLDLRVEEDCRASLVEVTVGGKGTEIGRDFVYAAAGEGLYVLPHPAGPLIRCAWPSLTHSKIMVLTATERMGFKVWLMGCTRQGNRTLGMAGNLSLPIGVTMMVMRDSR